MLDRATIERLEAASADAPILIALSGGGDSTALLHLLTERLGAARLRAAVVDHALRVGSAEDARRAAGFADALGVAADILTLTWPDGANRAQAAARGARYAALGGHARGIGARVIAVAHTGDDQAETVFMRAAGGSSWRGLSGMAAFASAPIWPEGRGVWVARPLLGARRAALRAALSARHACWIDDPANANFDYERVRVRARLAELEAGGMPAQRFADLAAALRPRADALDRAAASLIHRAVHYEDDVIVVDHAQWSGVAETRRRALSVLIAAAAGAPREPAAPALDRLEARMPEESFRGGSLGGATLKRVGVHVRITRDAGALLGRADGAQALASLGLPAHLETVWDGRLALTARQPGWSIAQGAHGVLLRNAERELQLGEASGVAAARWLLADHTRHLLGEI